MKTGTTSIRAPSGDRDSDTYTYRHPGILSRKASGVPTPIRNVPLSSVVVIHIVLDAKIP
jgi:hypothetical protein